MNYLFEGKSLSLASGFNSSFIDVEIEEFKEEIELVTSEKMNIRKCREELKLWISWIMFKEFAKRDCRKASFYLLSFIAPELKSINLYQACIKFEDVKRCVPTILFNIQEKMDEERQFSESYFGEYIDNGIEDFILMDNEVPDYGMNLFQKISVSLFGY